MKVSSPAASRQPGWFHEELGDFFLAEEAVTHQFEGLDLHSLLPEVSGVGRH